MNLKVYDNKIIAPCKCGTRYLDKIWREYEDSSELTIFGNSKWKKFEGYYIFRPPMEHLVSALHTEILGREDYESVDDIIDRFLSKKGTTHWSGNMYKGLWEYCSYNKKVKPIPLSQLTKLVKSLGIEPPKYDKTDYEFRHLDTKWVSKETIVKDIQRDYEIEWEWLTKLVEDDEIYYEKIVNGEWKTFNLL